MSGKDDRQFDDELMARAAELPQSVSPERDLWPEIQQAIDTPARVQRSAWSTIWARAAAVVLLVGGSSGVTYLAMNKNDVVTTPVAMETQVFSLEAASASFGSQYNLGPGYLDARRTLTENLGRELLQLSPEAREEILKNIQTIRLAIDDINEALAEEPDNVLLQELLLDTYRDELSLMRKVDDITRAAMRRGDI